MDEDNHDGREERTPRRLLTDQEFEAILSKVFGIKDIELRSREKPQGLWGVASEIVGSFKTLFSISDEEFSLKLVERLCRMGSAEITPLVLLLFVSVGRKTITMPAGFPNLFLPSPNNEVPSECKLIEDGDNTYSLIIKGSTGNTYCTKIFRIESEGRLERYIIYPCPEKK